MAKHQVKKWKTSNEHTTSPSQRTFLGPTHTDTYGVDAAGNRATPHESDLKVSGPKYEPSMKDIQSGSNNSGK